MAHILVVDDDEIVAERAAQVLIDAGHACGWVSDAETAMRVIQRRCPDLLILEADLPGGNGTNLLRRLRQSSRFYDLPVIMLTRAIGYEEEQIAYFHGAHDYIRKPFVESMLQFRVKQLLEPRRDRPTHRPLAVQLGIEAPREAAPGMRRV